MFCGDCYASAANSNSGVAASFGAGKATTFKCPICQTICSATPRPMLPWLANENKALPIAIDFSNANAFSSDDTFDQLHSFLRMMNSQLNCDGNEQMEHSQIDESEVPGTCLPLHKDLSVRYATTENWICRSGKSLLSQQLQRTQHENFMPQTEREEIPGTYLSFPDGQRVSTVDNMQQRNQFDSQMHHGNVDDSHVGPMCNGQTEEVAGTYLSFLDRQRISTCDSPLSETCVQTEEVIGTHFPFLDHHKTASTRYNANNPQPDLGATTFARNIESNSQTQDNVRATSSSISCNEAVNGQTEEIPGAIIDMPSILPMDTEEADVSDFGVKRSILQFSESCNEQTEEVAGTHISFLERHKMKAARIEPVTKRRRVTTSPLPKMISCREKSSDQIYHCNENNDQNQIMSASIESSMEKRRVSPSNDIVHIRGKKNDTINGSTIDKQLCIAADILDPSEANALELLNREGRCIVVNGVYSVSNGQNKTVPFPSILVTHASNNRSYKYVKALALGARVVDSRWLVDSKRAGKWLDYDPYAISGDFSMPETRGNLRSLPPKSRVQLLKGLRFGIASGRNVVLSCATEDNNDCDRESLDSELKLRTKLMTSHQVM
jgi:hypothetical protein